MIYTSVSRTKGLSSNNNWVLNIKIESELAIIYKVREKKYIFQIRSRAVSKIWRDLKILQVVYLFSFKYAFAIFIVSLKSITEHRLTTYKNENLIV